MHKRLNNQPESEEPNNGKQQSFPFRQDNCCECRQDGHLDGSHGAPPQMFVVMQPISRIEAGRCVENNGSERCDRERALRYRALRAAGEKGQESKIGNQITCNVAGDQDGRGCKPRKPAP